MNPRDSINQNHVIRVFVSSTFRDMHDERNYLVKSIFPQLRKLCDRRGVVWGEVDLRWGVTEEQKAEGKVLPICLEEIKRCRPYFIGILGNRYGWVPDEIPLELIEKEEWLIKHPDHSVTELEILHGVLRNPEMTKHAFFYFRDPEASFRVEEELKKEGDYTPESELSHKKLSILKETIRGKGFPVHENYPDAKALGEMVLMDLTTVINKLYPEGSQPDPLDREASEHRLFAQSRAKVYIGRNEYFEKLNDHIIGDCQPIIITGESGSGKSALLSNWALRFSKDNPDSFLIMHFIGASPYSADWASMLRRIMGELKRRFKIQQEIPEKSDDLRSAFANWLSMASAKGRVIIIIDALTQLEDRDGSPDLVWLPQVIPSNIRMIMSTLPGRPLAEIEKRSWKTMSVALLSEDERSLFIEEYLRQYTKSLNPALLKLIASQEPASCPLYLKALLEELRLFGKHEELEKHISHYLEAKSVPALFGKILARYEEDYESERPGLVRDIMTSIWASRNGMQESELLEVAGKEGNHLPRAIWTPLFLAAEHSLVDRSGIINFSHDYFRKAVQYRYLQSEREQDAAHLRLGDYFSTSEATSRIAYELPWQQMQAKSWQRLRDILMQPSFFRTVWDFDHYDIKTYWSKLEENGISKVSTYQFVIDNPENEDKDFVNGIASLLRESGHPELSLALTRAVALQYFNANDMGNYQSALGTQAIILHKRGEYVEAMRLYKEQESICSLVNYETGVAISRGNQALIFQELGEYDQALKMLQAQDEIYKRLGEKEGLAVSLGNQANIYFYLKELDEAMKLYKEAEIICREQGNKSYLSGCLTNQATILETRGETEAAMYIYKEQEQIFRDLGDKDSLQSCLCHQGMIKHSFGEYTEALKLYFESETLCTESGDAEGLQAALGNHAATLEAMGDYDRSIVISREQERICREYCSKRSLQAALGSQALILQSHGKSDRALQLFSEQETICREMGNKDSLSRCLASQALIFESLNDTGKALKLHKEEEKICRELNNKHGLQLSLASQAVIHQDRGELDEAMVLYKEQEQICRETQNISGLKLSLGNQVLILRDRSEIMKEFEMHQELVRICRDTDDKAGLASTLINEAVLLSYLLSMHVEALPLAQEAYKIAITEGLFDLAQQIEPILEYIRSNQ